jgi:hypothetical protein
VSEIAHEAVSCYTVCLLSSHCATRGNGNYKHVKVFLTDRPNATVYDFAGALEISPGRANKWMHRVRAQYGKLFIAESLMLEHQAFYFIPEPNLIRFGKIARVRQKGQHQHLVLVS